MINDFYIDYNTHLIYNQDEYKNFWGFGMHFIKVTDDVYLLKTPFSIVWSGVVLILGEKNFLIDSGAHDPQAYIEPALAELGMTFADVDWLLHTHAHGDHINAHAAIAERYGTRVACLDKQLANLTEPAANAIRIRTKFPEYSPPPQSWLKGVQPDRVLGEFELLEDRLMPIWTPGHDSDCVCWYDHKTKYIFTGDSLQGNGTPTQGIGFYQSLDDYLYTLRKLRVMDVQGIVLGHEYDGLGEIIEGREKVLSALDTCLEYVKSYDAFIKKMHAQGNDDSVEITKKLIGELGCGQPENLFLALYTVNEHLQKMQ